jgi:predicted GNAT superfamily acetyltransferase
MSTKAQPIVEIRDIDLVSEMAHLEAIQKEVWGWDDRDTMPPIHFIATKEVGGILIGAFDGKHLVGFAYGFVGYEGGSVMIHSHLLAVKPAYRNHNLGYKLKLAQRERALAKGFKHMTWTFDPLQSVNAHLNFSKLGVIADKYKINYYGEGTSSFLHRDIGTDRLWVTWLLGSRRVIHRLETQSEPRNRLSQLEGAAPLVRLGPDGAPCARGAREGRVTKHILIEVPADIALLQRENPGLAIQWREATRRAFTDAMAAGYLVEDFYRLVRNGQRLGVYLLNFARMDEVSHGD